MHLNLDAVECLFVACWKKHYVVSLFVHEQHPNQKICLYKVKGADEVTSHNAFARKH